MIRLLQRWLDYIFETLFFVHVGTTAGLVVGFGLVFATGLPVVQWAKDRYGAAAHEFGPLMITAMAVLASWLAAAFCVQRAWLFARSVRQGANRARS